MSKGKKTENTIDRIPAYFVLFQKNQIVIRTVFKPFAYTKTFFSMSFLLILRVCSAEKWFLQNFFSNFQVVQKF